MHQLRLVSESNVGVEPTWAELLTMFSSDMVERGLAGSLRSGRLSQLRRLARESHGRGPVSLTRVDLVTFLSREEWSFNTRKAHRASVADFFGWAHSTGVIALDPARDLPSASHLGEPSNPGTRTIPELSAETAAAIERAIEHPARAWGRQAGYPTAPSGRLSAHVLQAWHAAGCPLVGVVATGDAQWDDLLDGYVREMRARGLRASTVQQRLGQLRQFVAQFGDEPSAVNRDHLIWFLSDPSWSPATRRSKRAALVTFFSWAYDDGRLASNPSARVPPVRVPHGAPSPAPETMIRDAANGARDDVRLMVLLGALAGLRRAEIATLHTACVTDEGLRVVGKGGHARIVPLHPSLAREIDAYRAARQLDSGWFFTHPKTGEPYTVPHVGHLISRRMPPGWTAHKLRHRFASRSYAGQYNLRAVQELLGHASPAVTARYVAIPDTALVDAVLAVPPVPGLEVPHGSAVHPGERPVSGGEAGVSSDLPRGESVVLPWVNRVVLLGESGGCSWGEPLPLTERFGVCVFAS